MKPQISDMHPKLQEYFKEFSAKMAEAGVPFALTCVLRTKAEQTAYYAQGRKSLVEVNKLRQAAGMSMLVPSENKYTVTSTMNSKHFPDVNGKSRAFDIVILKNGKTLVWDIKWDGDKDGIPDYLEAANIAREIGLEAGAFWKTFKDWPHMQLPASIK